MQIRMNSGNRGATIEFGGCLSHVRRKDVAMVMATAPKLVWSVRPRRGFVVLSVTSGDWYKYAHIVEPGDHWPGIIHAISVHYLERLQCLSMSKKASRGW